MVGTINADRWQSYIRDIYRTLRPGGWCQMVEIYYNAQSDNGTLTDGSSAFLSLLAGAADTNRRRPRLAKMVENVYGERPAVQKSSSAHADIDLDATSRLHRGTRTETDTAAYLQLAKRCVSLYTWSRSRSTSRSLSSKRRRRKKIRDKRTLLTREKMRTNAMSVS